MNRVFAVVTEALKTARAQPVASIVSMIIVSGMVATVLLTTGRTVGAEQSILSSIDSAGTRSILIRAEGDAGLDTSVLSRISAIDGIAWAAAFGPAKDVTNATITGGTKVPSRLAWGTQFGALGVPDARPVEDRMAWASQDALDQLGMPEGAGGIITSDGIDLAIVGRITVPDYLRFLEPVVLTPQRIYPNDPQPVSIVVIIADRPDLVAPIAQTTLSLLAVTDPTKITLSTSEDLATLRALVEGQLGSFGRNLVIVVFAITALLVSAILYGLVMLRRKDFGRRRALGASKGLIIGLLLIQMAALSTVGAIAGSIGAAIGLLASKDPLPGVTFFAAVSILAVTVGVASALLPAIAAARRDPLTELRVP